MMGWDDNTIITNTKESMKENNSTESSGRP